MKFLITALFLLLTTACGYSESSNAVIRPNNAANDPVSSNKQPAVNSQTAKPPTADEAGIKSRIEGIWLKEGKTECHCGSCLEIQFNKKIDDFCVESDQIFVSADYKLDAANNRVNLFFKDTTELGKGGANLPWEKYDREKPIAAIDISKTEQKFITVNWLGFTEKGGTTARAGEFGKEYTGRYFKKEAKSGKPTAANDGKNFDDFLNRWRTAFKAHDKAALKELMSPDFSQDVIGQGADVLLQGIDTDKNFNWKFFDKFSAQNTRPGDPSSDGKPIRYISYDACSASFELSGQNVWQWKNLACGDD